MKFSLPESPNFHNYCDTKFVTIPIIQRPVAKDCKLQTNNSQLILELPTLNAIFLKQ